MKGKALVSACLVLCALRPALAGIEQLYGRWEGTWYVDEQFDENGPYGSPPYPSERLAFDLHALPKPK